jgi:hypothetical protein
MNNKFVTLITLFTLATLVPLENTYAESAAESAAESTDRRGGGGRGGFGGGGGRGGGGRGGAPRVSRPAGGARHVSRPVASRPAHPIARPAPGRGNIGRGGVPARMTRPSTLPSRSNIYRHIGAAPTRPFPGTRPGGGGYGRHPSVRPPIASRPPLRPSTQPPRYRGNWLGGASSVALRSNLANHWQNYHRGHGYFPYGRAWYNRHGAHGWWWNRPGFNPWVIPGLVAIRNWIGASWYYPGSYYAPIEYYDQGAAVETAYEESVAPVINLTEVGAAAPVEESADWLSLGVYGLIKPNETNYTVTIQLAVSKESAIRGYQTDIATNSIAEVVGAIDPKTLRAAWQAEGSTSLLFETSVDNLDQREFLANVYDPVNKTAMAWQMVRAEEPSSP